MGEKVKLHLLSYNMWNKIFDFNIAFLPFKWVVLYLALKSSATFFQLCQWQERKILIKLSEDKSHMQLSRLADTVASLRHLEKIPTGEHWLKHDSDSDDLRF